MLTTQNNSPHENAFELEYSSIKCVNLHKKYIVENTQERVGRKFDVSIWTAPPLI